MSPHFINVDFEFRSVFDLAGLAHELKDKIEVLVCEKINDEYHLNFECCSFESNGSPGDIIFTFFCLIAGLTDEGRKVIAGCSQRVIDLGYSSGSEGWCYSAIPSEVLKKMLDGGFELKISIYGG